MNEGSKIDADQLRFNLTRRTISYPDVHPVVLCYYHRIRQPVNLANPKILKRAYLSSAYSHNASLYTSRRATYQLLLDVAV